MTDIFGVSVYSYSNLQVRVFCDKWFPKYMHCYVLHSWDLKEKLIINTDPFVELNCDRYNCN